MRTIRFFSVGGAQYTLTIEDGAEQSTEMLAGVEAFTTQMDDDNDVFCPVRTQSGNIQIVGGVDDVVELMAAQPKDRKVELRAVDSEGTDCGLVWQGFLQTRAFSQAWDRAPIYVTLPVMGCLDILKSFYPSSVMENMGYRSFANMLALMNHVMSEVLWTEFYFPVMSNPLTTLTYSVCMKAWADWIEKENRWQTWNYFDILQDICKVFGWQCMEHGAALMFVAVDSTAGYVKLTDVELETLAAGTAVTGTSVSVVADDEKIYGADHHIDYVDGKKKVVVTGDVQPIDEQIWAFDIEKYEPGTYYSHYITDGGDNNYFYTRNYPNNSEIECFDSNRNFHYENYVAGHNLYDGACMASERMIEVEATNNAMPSRDTDWMNHFVFKSEHLSANQVMITIKPADRFIYNKLMENKWLVFNMRVQGTPGSYDDLLDYTGYIRVRIKIGQTELFMGQLWVEEGKLVYRYGWKLTAQGYGMSLPAHDGAITVEILSFDPMEYWEDYNWYFYLSEVTLSLSEDWTQKQKWTEKDENTETVSIGGGYEDEYHVDFSVTTYRTAQFGWGIIMGANAKTDAVPTTLYNGKTPEKALADRVAAYYGESRKQLVVEMKVDGQALMPVNRHSIDGNGEYVCVSQSVDWVNDVCRGRMCEME